MYSYEDCIRVVKFYINCGYNARYTVRRLGYLVLASFKMGKRIASRRIGKTLPTFKFSVKDILKKRKYTQ